MSTTVFVVVLVGGILALQLMMSGAILVWMRHRRRIVTDRLGSELADEAIIRSPERGTYRGASAAGYPKVKNDGIIALTRQRLVFHTLTGRMIEVPVADITGFREAKAFRNAVTASRQHLIIQTASGEIGFYVSDNAAWLASLRSVGVQPATEQPVLDDASIARMRRNSKKIVAVVFTAIGLALGLAAGISAAVVAESVSGGRSAEGTVVELSDTGRSYVPVVEFVPPDGAPVRFTGRVGSNPPAYAVGDRVPVLYSPDDPQDAAIDLYWQMWFVPTLIGLIGAPFLVAGVAFGIVTLLAARRADTAESKLDLSL